ncbi:C2H2-type zinc finger protein, partial [Salmonella sp. s51228]|uniref:C2H2-type zinc finger protein n=1 Tax=Salmonella sp. s51228 TaxID=3159652 RepID=UPI00398037EA
KRKRVSKPWCWYCDREFEEEKILIHHQKSKHFRCNICAKKLYTAPGLVIHCQQVHKITITEIPNVLSHRNNLDLDIYGTEGVPQADKDERESKNFEIDSTAVQKPIETTGIAYIPAPGHMIPMLRHMPNMPLIMGPSPFMHPPMQAGPLPVMQAPLPLQINQPLFASGAPISPKSSTEQSPLISSIPPTPLFP